MAVRKKTSRNKINKSDLKSGITNILTKGVGRSALIPDNLDEAMANNPEQLVKELSNHFAMVPLAEIEANPDQPRTKFEPEALQELAESLKVHGIIQPITVRRLSRKEYQIISGERRWRAAKLAQLEEVPAFIRIANDQTLMEMALIENIQRQDLNPIEIASTYDRLKNEFSLTDQQLAERVGKKRSTITNYLGLLDLHPEVLDALRSKKISMGHAKPIIGISDILLQKELLREILDKKLSVRKTEALAQTYKAPRKKPAPKTRTKNQFELERERILQDFRAFFGHKKIKLEMEHKEGEKGQIIIQFEDNDQLHNLFKCIEQL